MLCLYLKLQATKILKERMRKGELEECVIIAVTAYDSNESEKECIEAGIDKISIPNFNFFVHQSF